MCNGDLGMYRVMPWAYPTIPGQSSGGTSVDPTPEPVPDVDPYDFSNVEAKIVSRRSDVTVVNDSFWRAVFTVSVTGIIVNDSTGVSSFIGQISTDGFGVSPSGWEFTGTNYTVSDVSQPNGNGTITVDSKTGNPFASLSGNGKITFSVYDKTGNLIQSKEVVIT